jgi:chromate transporter
MIYVELFISFLQIGLFSIGGGFAALPLIQNQIVDIHSWLSLKEFVDVISIAEMTPGPIAINSATFVGIKIAGIGGAIVATIGCILPSCVIVLLLAYLYHRYKKLAVVQGILNGLRPAVVALIASAGVAILLLAVFGKETVTLEGIDWQNVIVTIVCCIMLYAFKLNPIWVIGGAGAAGLFFYYTRSASPIMTQIADMMLLVLILIIQIKSSEAFSKGMHRS